MGNKLAVAIPSYNRRLFVERLLSTIPEDILTVVSDNGAYLREGLGCRRKNIRIESHDVVLDVFDNWNFALNMVLDECDYLVMPSDDDLYLSGWSERVLKYIDKIDADIFIFGSKVIDEFENVVGEYSEDRLTVLEAPLGFLKYKYSVNARMPSVFFRSKFIRKIGGYDSKAFKLTAADSELIQRALLLGRVAFIPEVISCYRVWSGGLTNKKIASEEWLDEIEKWTDKIIMIGQSNADIFTGTFSENYADEIYARNLYEGLVNLYRREEYRGLLSFKSKARWPKKALFRTRLRIVRLVLKAKILSYVG
ncbi:MAG TPA: hypothetical protein DD408_13030 [Rheinheimera sp.]|nr:hypothetical protein [Rheinheimera sp.]